MNDRGRPFDPMITASGKDDSISPSPKLPILGGVLESVHLLASGRVQATLSRSPIGPRGWEVLASGCEQIRASLTVNQTVTGWGGLLRCDVRWQPESIFLESLKPIAPVSHSHRPPITVAVCGVRYETSTRISHANRRNHLEIRIGEKPSYALELSSNHR